MRQDPPSAPLPLPPLPLGAAPAPYATLFVPAYPIPIAPHLPYSFLPYVSPPRVWTVFVAVVVAFVSGAVVGGLVPIFMIVAENGGVPKDPSSFSAALMAGVMQPAVLLSSGATTQLMLLVTALSAAILSPIPLVRRLRLNPSTLSILGYIIAPIGALCVSLLFSSIVQLLNIHESGSLKLMGDVFKKLTPGELVAAILIVGIAPGFAEEFLFRGYAQTRLVRRWGRWAGIVIAAVMFGIMHMDLLQSPFALGFGLYIGYVVEKCGSIRPGMVCHAFNNSIQVLGAWYFAEGTTIPDAPAAPVAPASMQASIVLALVSVSVLALCTLYFRFVVRPPAPVESPALL